MRRAGGAGLLRRALVRAGISGLTAAAVAVARPAGAQPKASKAAAGYQSMPQGGLSCAVCTLFRPPARCVVVSGVISPHGWCKFFSLPD
jgi:hypothetical protein